jgi:hypothetical protein
VTLEARASSCSISGAPCPRAWPISGAPQTDATGKQSGFQLLGLLLLLRENTTKLVRPWARFNSRIHGLKYTNARRSGTFLGLVDRGGGSCGGNPTGPETLKNCRTGSGRHSIYQFPIRALPRTVRASASSLDSARSRSNEKTLLDSITGVAIRRGSAFGRYGAHGKVMFYLHV